MTSLLVENHAIKNILRKHELPTQMQEISSLRKIEWKNKVRVAIEKSNTQRLLDECHKYEQGEKIRKTKTAHIVDAIMSTGYQRAISNELLKCNRTETKAIMIARFRMLECGKNFKGTQSAICSVCSILDDEAHRLNYCTQFEHINYCNSVTKIDFAQVFSNNVDILKEIIHSLSKVWNVRNANGSMNE